MSGRTRWFFPDAERPEPGEAEPFGHESIIVLNPNDTDATVQVTLYSVDRAPDRFEVTVAAERVRCLRTNVVADMGGREVTIGEQYAIGLASDVPVVAQYGRLDVTQPNMAFYSTPGYYE